jgi:Rrf2 family protein
MKLTLSATYALHALIYLASQYEKTNGRIASKTIAKKRGINDRFLLKVLKPLVNAKILHANKGPRGGYALKRAPAEISVLEIIEAVEGDIKGFVPEPREILDGYSPAISSRLETVCEETAVVTRKHLEKVRLSQLVPKKG